MTVPKLGMVIDVNLSPRQESETGKIRPCVVVTNDVSNAKTPVIQVVPITEWNEKKGVSSRMSSCILRPKTV